VAVPTTAVRLDTTGLAATGGEAWGDGVRQPEAASRNRQGTARFTRGFQ
jgi:hypothetical protein